MCELSNSQCFVSRQKSLPIELATLADYYCMANSCMRAIEIGNVSIVMVNACMRFCHLQMSLSMKL